jgi:hypothetical protein
MRQNTQKGTYITIRILKLTKEHYIIIKIHNNKNRETMIKNVTKSRNVINERAIKQQTSSDLYIF